MNKKDNFILETFLKLTSRTYPYGTETVLVEEMIDCGLFPENLQTDEHGNYFYKIGESRTVFASHLDTACKDSVSVSHVFDGDMIKTDGKTILGADDKAGVTILLNMIRNNIPGLYYFFIGEEVGCIGSGAAAASKYFKDNYDRVISFDRRDTGSVITYQSSSRCCSDVFADALCKQLNANGMSYKKDEGGVYTDSAEFVGYVSECTNISVGYYKEHTVNESQDIKHLEDLAEACLKIDWENLPVERDPSKTEYRSYNNYGTYNNGWNWKSNKSTSNWRSRDYGYHDDWYDQSPSQNFISNDDGWPGEEEYGKFKKSRRNRSRRGKSYMDIGNGNLVQMKEPDKKFQQNFNNDHIYDSLIDKILDQKMTKNDLEIVKDQYLNMNNEQDRVFYEYLLGNIV